MNNMIAKEKFDQKVAKFQNENFNIRDKWKLTKKETGQDKFQTPQMIFENGINHTSPKKMASTLNRQLKKKK